jgi:hypothetical protein
VALAKGEARNDNRLVPTVPAPIWAIVAFVVLVLALSWLRLLPRAVDLPPVLADGVLLYLASFGPIIVALLLVGYTHAGAGRWRWLRESFAWRRGIRWYAIAVAGPVALTVLGVAWLVISGRAVPDVDVPMLAGALGILVVAFVFSLGEEYG